MRRTLKRKYSKFYQANVCMRQRSDKRAYELRNERKNERTTNRPKERKENKTDFWIEWNKELTFDLLIQVSRSSLNQGRAERTWQNKTVKTCKLFKSFEWLKFAFWGISTEVISKSLLRLRVLCCNIQEYRKISLKCNVVLTLKFSATYVVEL